MHLRRIAPRRCQGRVEEGAPSAMVHVILKQCPPKAFQCFLFDGEVACIAFGHLARELVQKEPDISQWLGGGPNGAVIL